MAPFFYLFVLSLRYQDYFFQIWPHDSRAPDPTTTVDKAFLDNFIIPSTLPNNLFYAVDLTNV
jgi:hypothetical protein